MKNLPLFEDEWREIMSNFHLYSKYYIEKPEFRELFNKRLESGEMRGWISKDAKRLNLLKQEFKKFSQNEAFSSDISKTLSLIDIEKQPFKKLKDGDISWYPVSHDPFKFEIKNYLTGKVFKVNRKKLQENVEYLADVAQKMAQAEIDNYDFS